MAKSMQFQDGGGGGGGSGHPPFALTFFTCEAVKPAFCCAATSLAHSFFMLSACLRSLTASEAACTSSSFVSWRSSKVDICLSEAVCARDTARSRSCWACCKAAEIFSVCSSCEACEEKEEEEGDDDDDDEEEVRRNKTKKQMSETETAAAARERERERERERKRARERKQPLRCSSPVPSSAR